MRPCYCYGYGRENPKLICRPGHLTRALGEYAASNGGQRATVVYVHPSMLSVLAPEAPKSVEVRIFGGCSMWQIMVEDVTDGEVKA